MAQRSDVGFLAAFLLVVGTKMKTVSLQGNFNDQDLKELAVALRVIEQRRPHEHFSMLVESNDQEKGEDLKQKLLNLFPALKDVPVEVRVVNRVLVIVGLFCCLFISSKPPRSTEQELRIVFRLVMVFAVGLAMLVAGGMWPKC